MAHHWHRDQRQRSTNIHKPNLCLVAYWRYAHKQGKDERQRTEAEMPVMLFPYYLSIANTPKYSIAFQRLLYESPSIPSFCALE